MTNGREHPTHEACLLGFWETDSAREKQAERVLTTHLPEDPWMSQGLSTCPRLEEVSAGE